MANRTPSLDDLKKLSRDEWENFCALICASFYSANRVEDHFGKGNGLDSFRETEEGIDGWQFRKFNERLGDRQAKHIKDNIILAHKRCMLELNKPLINFTIFFNIDPEPGHLNSVGEIERLKSIKEWAKNRYNVDFKYRGMTWVLGMLLKNPTIKPELFEDVSAAINQVSASLHNEIFDIKNQLQNLLNQNHLEGKLKATFELLIREANKHYARGKELESKEEYLRSMTSLEDAKVLLENDEINVELEGKILAFLSGVEVISGFLNKAIEHGAQAVELLSNKEDSIEHYVFARGNLAFALYMNQDYIKSKKYFLEILDHFESEGNLLEIVRTLSHLLQMQIETGSLDTEINLINRVQSASSELDKLIGPTEVTVSASATIANLYAEVGIQEEDREYLKKAIRLYLTIESVSKDNGLKRMNLNSKSARARCLWNLDILDEAEILYNSIILEAKGFLPKVGTDAKYNLALLVLELGQVKRCKRLLSETINEYQEIGDFPSVQDAQDMLIEIS